LGITAVEDSAPFFWENIDAFGYKDIPVSFVETFNGQFDEVLATRQQGGGVVGFKKALGKGEVLVFGATLPANTLDDVDVVNRMALKMGCQPLFTMSEWADVRLSRGENGSFLFVNNYQDDPLETVIEYEGKSLYGGHPVILPARRGAILPLEWRLNGNVTVHYSTAEITEVIDDGSVLTLKTNPPEFAAELTLTGYTCAGAASTRKVGDGLRVSIRGKDGIISLQKENQF
jgi:beta-galactosidase